MERKATKPPTRRAWLNRSILGIGLASLFSDAGHEMATAAMPVLLASFGASSALLGLIEGTADGSSSFAKLFSGLYSDRLRRRKPLAVAGYFLTASAMASFAFATSWWHVLLARVGGWIGRGARSPVRNVLLTEATSPETYGRAFGLERAMDSAGAVIGPIGAVALLATIGLRPLFLLTLIPGVLAACAIIFLVKEKKHEPSEGESLWRSLRSLPDDFRRYLIGVGIAGIGDFSKTLLILWATQTWAPRFGMARAASLAMTFYIGYNVVYTISCYVSGMLADRFAKNWVLAIGYSVAVIPATALILPGDSLGKFAVVFAGAGVYMGVWETLESSTAATLLPARVRGLGFGVLATVNGIGDFVSSTAVGALWVVSPVAAMGLVIVSSLGGAAIIASTRPRP